MSVNLISISSNAEKLMGFIARVSNPANQFNDNVAGLLAFCIREGHWSVFEHAHMTLEITTTRDIGAQMLRHRSFFFQEFSQRYAAVMNPARVPELRLQDHKNRQNSLEVLDEESKLIVADFEKRIAQQFAETQDLYNDMLDAGIAKECARKVLPLNTETKIYMTGNVRQWIHYITLRSGNGTQKEHMLIAQQAKEVFTNELPIVAKALGWTSEA
ncbi:thymidylate synthase [Acinetobacter phage nACB1]|nr:thymidylate synthase [Acinetobacter phage nACB1]